MRLSDLPTLGSRPRCAVPKYAMPTRLDEAEDARKLDERRMETWKKAVRLRDKNRCRACGCKVIVTLKLQANQAHCHHIKTRQHRPTRYDRRNGVLLCRKDHQRVERNELVIAGVFFELDGLTYLNGDDLTLSFRAATETR